MLVGVFCLRLPPRPTARVYIGWGARGLVASLRCGGGLIGSMGEENKNFPRTPSWLLHRFSNRAAMASKAS